MYLVPVNLEVLMGKAATFLPNPPIPEWEGTISGEVVGFDAQTLELVVSCPYGNARILELVHYHDVKMGPEVLLFKRTVFADH